MKILPILIKIKIKSSSIMQDFANFSKLCIIILLGGLTQLCGSAQAHPVRRPDCYVLYMYGHLNEKSSSQEKGTNLVTQRQS